MQAFTIIFLLLLYFLSPVSSSCYLLKVNCFPGLIIKLHGRCGERVDASSIAVLSAFSTLLG